MLCQVAGTSPSAIRPPGPRPRAPAAAGPRSRRAASSSSPRPWTARSPGGASRSSAPANPVDRACTVDRVSVVSLSVTIPRPVADVFAVLTDVGNAARWSSALEEELLTPDPSAWDRGAARSCPPSPAGRWRTRCPHRVRASTTRECEALEEISIGPQIVGCVAGAVYSPAVLRLRGSPMSAALAVLRLRDHRPDRVVTTRLVRPASP